MSFFLMLNIQENTLNNATVDGTHDFHIIYFPMEANGDQQLLVLQNIFFCVQHKK